MNPLITSCLGDPNARFMVGPNNKKKSVVHFRAKNDYVFINAIHIVHKKLNQICDGIEGFLTDAGYKAKDKTDRFEIYESTMKMRRFAMQWWQNGAVLHFGVTCVSKDRMDIYDHMQHMIKHVFHRFSIAVAP